MVALHLSITLQCKEWDFLVWYNAKQTQTFLF
jgi:hypothetical protein